MERKLISIAWAVMCMIMLMWSRPDSLFVDSKDYQGRYNRLSVQYRWLSFPVYEVAYEAGKRYNIPPEVICAFIHAESRGNPRAYSYAGARGLMQVMPCYWYKSGNPNDLYLPTVNILLGTRILRTYLDIADGNLILAAKLYNAGNKDYFNGPYIVSIVRNVALSCPDRPMSQFILEL